ncbi:MAG: UDP-N-acetylmuramoyl-L-alanine--D-glutamate ligase, partial [Gammaproteobacteria bacterium]
MTDAAPAATSSRTALIVGLGRTGVSVARHLAARGWQLAVTDSRADPPGRAELERIAPRATCRYGGFDLALLGAAALVVASPGVSRAEPLLREAAAR